jgi:hypothetical protein
VGIGLEVLAAGGPAARRIRGWIRPPTHADAVTPTTSASAPSARAKPKKPNHPQTIIYLALRRRGKRNSGEAQTGNHRCIASYNDPCARMGASPGLYI